ncbi:Spy/CpxP family protein refolding chaperone [Lentisalinibacter orientalis]|uniref:Spy/CpxP family protein refolding chaperone n=1 Tax=Lentisalinibacter orientalis TaxID=2992241 RepID=UPI0038703905
MRGIIPGRVTGRALRRNALALAALLFAGAALAGPHGAGPHGGGPHGGPDPARMLAHMSAELDLSAEQREAVRQALDSRRDEIRTLHEQLRANHRELRNLDPADPNHQTLANTLAQRQGELTSRMALLRSETHADIMAALDEDQQARLTEMRADRMARMDQRRQKLQQHQRPSAPGGAGAGQGRGAGPDANDSGAKEDDVL